jgi:hypothetical protein
VRAWRAGLVVGLLFFATRAEADPAKPAPDPSPEPAPAPPPPPAGEPPSAAPPATAPPPPGGHWVFVQDAPGAAPPATAPPAASGPLVRSERGPVYLHANTWDLNIEGAVGRFYGSEAHAWTGFGRVRAGGLFIREPLYLSLGMTYEFSDLSKATFGVQGEVMHLDLGLWAQGGGLLDVAGHAGGMLAVGWSLFGVETQLRQYDGLGSGIAVYAKLRLPISIIARIFAKPRPVQMVPASSTPPPQ